MNKAERLFQQILKNQPDEHKKPYISEEILSQFWIHPTQFFIECEMIITYQTKIDVLRSNEAKVRNYAGKVVIALILDQTYRQVSLWNYCWPQERMAFKNGLLLSLCKFKGKEMTTIMDVIVAIATIQIPSKQCTDIISFLSEHSMKTDNINKKSVCIFILSNICENIIRLRYQVPGDYCEQILRSFLLGLREQGEIADTSFAAIKNSIVFLGNLLENADCCNQTFNILLPYLNSDHCQKVYQILVEFGKTCYHLLGNCIGGILNKTVEHIQERNGNTLLALEFWDTVGTEYLRRYEKAREQGINIRNYIEELHKTLLPEVMASVLILSESDKNFPEMRERAVKTLSTFVSCGGINLVQEITDGVTKVVYSPEWRNREASALLFSCLCEYPDKAYIEGCFMKVFTHLYQLINDPEEIVRRKTFGVFKIIAKNFPKAFLNNNEFVNFFQKLIKHSDSKEKHARQYSLSIISTITMALIRNIGNECLVTVSPFEILSYLLSYCCNNWRKGKNYIVDQLLIYFIERVVICAVNKQQIHRFMIMLLQQYRSFSNNNSANPKILSYLITIVHACILSVSSSALVQNETRILVFKFTIDYVKAFGIPNSGLKIVSEIEFDNSSDLKVEIVNAILPRIHYAFDKLVELDIRVALECLTDFARINDSRISEKLAPFLQKMVYCMGCDIDKVVKSRIIRCLGDLSKVLKNQVQDFIGILLSISDEYFQKAARLSDDFNEKSYIDNLKQAIIYMNHCLFSTQNQQQTINQDLANHFPRALKFIISTCQLTTNYKYLKLCVSLIFDSYVFYGKHPKVKEMINQAIKSKEVNYLVKNLRWYRFREEVASLMTSIDSHMNSL